VSNAALSQPPSFLESRQDTLTVILAVASAFLRLSAVARDIEPREAASIAQMSGLVGRPDTPQGLVANSPPIHGCIRGSSS
jgi:hypothetical protein